MRITKDKRIENWSSLRKLVLERDNYECRVCGKRMSGQVHHIISRRLGGSDDVSNLVTLCGRCQMVVSPVPDEIISKVWGLPLNKISSYRNKINDAIMKFVDK